jgi:hypothetical protein
MSYPNTPGYKASAPATSAQAARKVSSKAKELRNQMMEAYDKKDMTHDECAAAIRPAGMSDVTFETFKRNVRSRGSELKEQGLLEATETQRLNASRHSAVVWRSRKKAVKTFAPGYPQNTFRRQAGGETTNRCIQ